MFLSMHKRFDSNHSCFLFVGKTNLYCGHVETIDALDGCHVNCNKIEKINRQMTLCIHIQTNSASKSDLVTGQVFKMCCAKQIFAVNMHACSSVCIWVQNNSASQWPKACQKYVYIYIYIFFSPATPKQSRSWSQTVAALAHGCLWNFRLIV